jgi:hypothetical protein
MRLIRPRTALVLSFALTLLAGAALAVHDLGLFELDENAIDEAAPGDDWNQVYCDLVDPARATVCVGVAASTSLVNGFFFDPVDGGVDGSSDDIFAGAKDTLDIEAGAPQDWQWKLGASNDKNDIEHAFASLSLDAASGDYVLYFGADKLDNSGDAAIGFWFLQNPVTQLGDGSSNPPCVPSGCPFSHGHVVGDLLVQSDFTNGGDIGRLQAYVWDDGVAGFNGLSTVPVAPAQGELERIDDPAFVVTDMGGDPVIDCDDLAAGDNLCAQVNTQDETAPWDFLFKGPGGVAPSAVFPTATLFEGGINLSAIFPNDIPCFSAFLTETRQSQSETAELEDKVLKSFELCSVFVQKEGPEQAKVGDPVDYTITITNDGALPLTKVSIADDVLGDLTGECGATLDPDEQCIIMVSRDAMAGDPTPLVNTVTAVYDRAGDEVSDQASHSVVLVNPSITLDKKAEGSDGPLVVLQGATVDYTIELTNTSAMGTPPLECTITDPILGVNVPVTLASGDSHTVNASRVFAVPETVTNTATAVCSPQGFPNQIITADSVTVTALPGAQLVTIAKSGDAYSKVGDPVDYEVVISNIGTIDLTLDQVTDTVAGELFPAANPLVTFSNCDASFPVGDSCTIDFTRTTQAGDPDPLVNVVTAYFSDALGGTGNVADDHSVDLVSPSFTVAKSCTSPEPVPPGASANFRIDIANTGDVDLLIDVTDTLLGIDLDDVLLGERGGAACGAADLDGDASDGCLRIEAGVTASGDEVANSVDVHATLPPPLDAVLDNQIDHSDDAVCDVEEEGATRTWGFWKTHGSDGKDFPPPVDYGYTCHVFEDHLGGSVNIGWKSLTSCEDVFGIFWSSPATESDGTKRDNLCRTQLQGSWQLLAAILNSALDNGATVPTDPVTGKSIIEAMIDALAVGDRQEIRRLLGDLGAYNESGDTVMIVDLDGAMIPQADPNGMRDVADYAIGDCGPSAAGTQGPKKGR